MSSRDFNTISPSAKSILFMKALTDIPFAKEAAAFIPGEEEADQLLMQRDTPSFLPRVIHFENRYKTIDAMLDEDTSGNIIELSSGFSFRGLAMTVKKAIQYIDTDLPAMVDMKRDMTERIKTSEHLTLKGNLQVRPLNVLNEDEFLSIIDNFPPGPVTIVNEGLLVYLDELEKRKLCAIIKKIFENRGGSWITGDIYIRHEQIDKMVWQELNDRTKKFYTEHHIEENKFESFEEAASFFEGCGFRIIDRNTFVPERLSSLKLLSEEFIKRMEESFGKGRDYPINRQTWRVGL